MAHNIPGRGPLLAGTAVLALLVCTQAHAQSMNYGELEQIFGEPVTTSATGKPQKVSDVPANMEIITQDDIRRSGADNLVDLLRFVTGIDVRTGAFGDASVSVRGLNQPNSPRLLVLLNGRQVYNDDYGYVAWLTIPVELDEIRQIEVVKGPNSALFGFNAVSGVINIVTYDALYDKVNAATGRTGTQSLLEGSAVATVHGGDWGGVRVSVGGYRAHDYADDDTYNLPTTPERGSVSADGKFVIAPGVEGEITASQTSAAALTMQATGLLDNDFFRTNSVGATLRADTPIGTVGLNFYRNELLFAIRNDQAPINWNNTVYVVQANDIVKLGTDHTVRLGLEFRDNALSDINGGDAFGPGIGYRVYAASAMWDWQITPALSLTNALRGDELVMYRNGPDFPLGFTNAQFNGRSIFVPTFNSGLVWQASDLDTLRLTAARGAGLPSLFELGNVYAGNPLLQPTIVYNYELDYDRQLSAIGATFRSALFYQENQQITAIGAGAGPNIMTPLGFPASIAANIGSANEFGIELGLKGHTASGLRWNASYSLGIVHENVIANQGGNLDTPFDYQRGTPQHVVTLGAGYTWDKLELDAEARWQSRYRDYYVTYPGGPMMTQLISDYVTAALRAGYALTPNLTLAAAVEQANAATIRQTAGLAVARRVILSATGHF